MKGIKKEKTLLRENLKKFEEGVDYTVSSEFDDWESIEIKIYTVCSQPLIKSLRGILSSIRNWEDDEGFVYKIKESDKEISVSRIFSINSSSSEKEKDKFKETFSHRIVSGGNPMIGEQTLPTLVDVEKDDEVLINVKKRCSNCRSDKEVSADTNFCQHCGWRLTDLRELENKNNKVFTPRQEIPPRQK